MRPCSDRFKDALAASREIAVRAAVLEPGAEPVDVPLVGGAVTLDVTAASLGRMEATLADDGTLGLVPDNAQSLLAPLGNELRLWRGVRYADDEQELISLGIFQIEVTGVDDAGAGGHSIHVSGLDRSGRVIAAKIETPFVIRAGTNVEAAIVALLTPIMPGLQWVFPGVKFTTPVIVVEEGKDRWQLVQDMATACGLVLYFDGDGVLRLEPLLGGFPVAEYLEGEGGLLVAAKREWRNEGSYSVAVVTGENTGLGAPVRATAMDLNPDSATYVHGKFGRRTVFLTSQLVTTQAQAQAAADALLLRQLGTTELVSFSTRPDPTLVPGDAVQLLRQAIGVDEAHIIEQMVVPLDAETVMQAGTRAVQVVEFHDQVQASIDNMRDLGAADRAASLARSSAVNAGSVASQFLEDWANRAAWEGNAGAQQVSAGRLFSSNAGIAAGLAHAFPLPSNGAMRVTTTVRTVDGNGGNLLVGVSADGAGATPTIAGLSARGILFDPQGHICRWEKGRSTILTSPPGYGYVWTTTPLVGTQDWGITITTDAQFIYFSIRNLATGVTIDTAFARYGVPVNNLFVYNSDVRQLAGSSIGKISARLALSTVTPANRVTEETVDVAVFDGGRVIVKAVLPPAFDSSVGAPVILGYHGAGGNANTFDSLPFARALVAAGFILLSSAYTPNPAGWGAHNGVGAGLRAYWWLRDRYPVKKLVACGLSMGGITSLVTLAGRDLPGIYGWIGVNPACDLDWFYANGYAAAILAAYGITTLAQYEARTVDRDPMDMPPRLLREVPMLFGASSDDIVAPRSVNSAALYARVDPYCEATILDGPGGGIGGHTEIPPAWTDPIVDFALDCVA